MEAWLEFISEFQFVEASFEPQEPDPDPEAPPHKRRSFKTSYDSSESLSTEGFFPDFPVLMSGVTGCPWTLGNLYLVRRLAFSPTAYESATFESIARDLVDYLRFLEAEQLDPLAFHARFKVRRPTYQYRQNLVDKIQNGSLSPSTASQRMNRVIAFYKGLVSYDIMESAMLDRVHETRTVLIPIISASGFANSLAINTSDLAIKKQAKAPDVDCIHDGGKLMPLEKNDQDALFAALKESERCIFLMFLFALMTGARIQTIGTMRIEAIKKAKLSSDGFYRIKVGPETKVDTKNAKSLILMVPKSLHEALRVYIESPIAKKRRERSYYRLSDENYIFLNRGGEPYYTSKSERKERRNSDHHAKVGIYSASSHIKPKAGDAIRTYIVETLLPRIRACHPEFPRFKFHDLRATFGMNCLESYLKQMDEHNFRVRSEGRDDFLGTQWALERVMERLGHRSIQTTIRYLDFKRKTQLRAKLIAEVEDELMQYVPEGVLEVLESR